MINIVNLCFMHYKEIFIYFVNDNSHFSEKQVKRDFDTSKIQATKKYELSYKMCAEEHRNKFERILINQIDEDNKNYTTTVKPYLNNIKKLDEELMNTRSTYENKLKEKDAATNHIKMKYEHQLGLEKAENEKLKSCLTTAKETVLNQKSQLDSAEMHNKTLVEDNTTLNQAMKKLKITLHEEEVRHDQHVENVTKLSMENEQKYKNNQERLYRQISILKDELERSKNDSSRLNQKIIQMQYEQQQAIKSIEQNQTQRKNYCSFL